MPSSNPLVSVIVPYCNRPRHLDMVLSAYETQSYDDVEILLVCEESASLEKLQQLTAGREIRCFRTHDDHSYGACASLPRNIGAANARGEILIINDLDVIPEREAVERFTRVHSANPGLVACGKIWRIEGGLGSLDTTNIRKRSELEKVSTPMAYDPALQWSTTAFLRKSDFWWSFISGFFSLSRRDFLFLTGYDPKYSGWGYEDTDLAYRALRHGRTIAFFEDIAGFHIDHPENGLNNTKALRNLEYFTHKFPELKSFPLLAKRRRELEEQGGRNSLSEDPLGARPRRLALKDLLAHPALLAHNLHREHPPGGGSIAVVIPAKNRALYLQEAVLSVVHQTRPAKEVIIVIEPSEDGTEALAEKLAQSYPMVQCIYNTDNEGVAEARNQGVVASASDYLMFLDSDDVLNPRYLEKVAAFLDFDRAVGIAYSDYAEFGDRNRSVSLPAFEISWLLVDCIIMGAAMARRSALEQSGGYDAEQVFEDWELWIRVIEAGWSARGVQEPLYNYRIHKGNRDLESNKRRKEGEDLIYQKHIKLYNQHGISRTADGKWVGMPVHAPFR